MTISNSTFTSDIWTDVRTSLVAASITAESTVASIVASFSDTSVTRPLVVIEPVTVDEAERKFGGRGKRFANVVVECYYKNTSGLDEMFDKVVDTIENESFDDIELVATSSDYAFNLGNDQKFHMKSVTFTFDRE